MSHKRHETTPLGLVRSPGNVERPCSTVLLVNLAGLCRFDGLRRTRSLRRITWRDNAPQDERVYVGTSIFLAISDSAYAVILAVGAFGLSQLHLDLSLEATAVALTWLVVRVGDWLMVR